jgi:hypothetical protein
MVLDTRSCQRFPMVSPRTVVSVGAGLAIGVAIVVFGFAHAASAHGGLAGALQVRDGRGRNGLIQLAVVQVGIAIGFMASLSGLLTVVVLSADGITLERWGKRRWHIPWSEYDGWQWEKTSEGKKVALVLFQRSRESQQLGVGWYYPTSSGYQSLVKALDQRTPGKGEYPSITVGNYDPVGILAVLLVVLFFAFMGYLLLLQL